MGPDNPTEVQHRELDYPCRTCGAAVGEWCSTSGGIRPALLHANRHGQWVESGDYPAWLAANR